MPKNSRQNTCKDFHARDFEILKIDWQILPMSEFTMPETSNAKNLVTETSKQRLWCQRLACKRLSCHRLQMPKAFMIENSLTETWWQRILMSEAFQPETFHTRDFPSQRLLDREFQCQRLLKSKSSIVRDFMTENSLTETLHVRVFPCQGLLLYTRDFLRQRLPCQRLHGKEFSDRTSMTETSMTETSILETSILETSKPEAFMSETLWYIIPWQRLYT